MVILAILGIIAAVIFTFIYPKYTMHMILITHICVGFSIVMLLDQFVQFVGKATEKFFDTLTAIKDELEKR